MTAIGKTCPFQDMAATRANQGGIEHLKGKGHLKDRLQCQDDGPDWGHLRDQGITTNGPSMSG